MMTQSDRDLERLFELDGSPGPARPVDGKRAAAIIAAAVGGAGFGPAGGGGGGLAPARFGKLALVGAGAIAIAIATIAWVATRDPSPPRADATESSAVTPPPIGSASATIVAVMPPVVDAPPIVAPPPEIEMPAIRDPKRTRAKATPEDLLAEANGERATHRWSEADALYARVVALPHAPRLAVQTALVASASLHLEHLGDPLGATRRFRAALAAGPNGALAEDARWGLAEAARASNDAAAERAALDDFLAHHASSPLAPRARTRRAEL